MSVARRLLAVGLVAAGLSLPGTPAAYAEEGLCIDIGEEDTDPVDEVAMPSAPLEELHIAEATEWLDARGKAPGAGVGVAVVDSGISAVAPVNRADGFRHPASRAEGIPYYHGTAVAGLIAGGPRPEDGAVGVAPSATVYDVRVYDTPEGSDEEGELELTDAGVIDGLNWVAANADRVRPRIRIVNVSLAVQRSDELETVIGRLAEQGILVVAASGNRPTDEDDPVLGDFAETPEDGQGEDAARVVFPAGFESVVAASTSVPRDVDPLAFIVRSSAIDIAAPTLEGVSYAVTGVSCLLPPEAATSWAAAEISGVLALLMSAFPKDSSEEILARLYRTATGPGDVTNNLTGHGIAQPVEALQRPLTFDDRGVPETSETNDTVLKARAPRPEADILADTRRDAVWWGLAGGGALVIALLLRPVLARRRTPDH